MINRDNSFDLIRHLAALAVLISHHYALSGLHEPSIEGFNSLGGIAVLAFFSVSGLLITQSFVNSSNLFTYMSKRAARIFPALIACAFAMVYIGGSLFSQEEKPDYTLSLNALTDFFKISTFGRADIESITSGFIFKESFNGSLWTLKIEFAFYVALALSLTILRRVAMPLLMTLALCATAYVSSHSVHPLAPKLLVYSAVGIAFFVGSTLHFYQHAFASTRAKLLIAGFSALLILVTLNTPLSVIFANIGFSLLVLSIGTLYKDRIINSRFDISYGMYLYAFPVQQVLINTTSLGFYTSMSASIAVVIVLATLSWFLVEKPALDFVHMKTRTKRSIATVA